MKVNKVFFVVLLSSFILSGANAQWVVSDILTETNTLNQHISQGIFFAKQVADMLQSLEYAYNTLQQGIYLAQTAAQNLRSFNISSWSDFMNWYNRQLYLTNEAESRFKQTHVQIGAHNYYLDQANQIPDAFTDTYFGFWDKEFTQDEKRDAWLWAGMTPGNYYYAQTWDARRNELLKRFSTGSDVVNDEQMKHSNDMKSDMDKLDNESSLSEANKMGTNEHLGMANKHVIGIREELQTTNQQLSDISSWLSNESKRTEQVPRPQTVSSGHFRLNPYYQKPITN